ncbi:hypothetical protein [Desulfovibrio intestinalis]|uniref:Uncharacterized protein n=1 Tax=Desulfovibrio intestinalis TaxID=58621 RepID=A0A7W8C2C1_9BACT|nr:hypothetical protein [Desulfovibrio intestinalis]MBB5143578.1 hypothetical protein [Desulfovibrio intestinalis]
MSMLAKNLQHVFEHSFSHQINLIIFQHVTTQITLLPEIQWHGFLAIACQKTLARQLRQQFKSAKIRTAGCLEVHPVRSINQQRHIHLYVSLTIFCKQLSTANHA